MESFDEDRMIHLYLPDDYLTSNKRYPVLYMFDGQNLFSDEDATFHSSWHLAQAIEERQFELIVVGQECSHTGNDRLDEYGPYPFADFEAKEAFNGYGDLTMDFFIHELKPYIDEHYPTMPQRETTWIGGSSCGGLMALYAHIVYSDIYSKSLVLSPFVSPVEDYLYLEAFYSELMQDNQMYISWGALEEGKHEFVKETKIISNIVSILSQKGMKFHLNVKENGRHCEQDWAQECNEFLEFLFE
ncbi:alpha/beta hydrolase [Floccifex sp.]|uniref:alpha/beta hydrolase n=1 Tax=Floccifex sp. TaxID=2815810 RepID=UPI003F025B68